MDATDFKIIELLKRNSRMTSSDISKHIHLTVPAVSERIRKLEENDVIKQYTLKLNREKFNQNLLAYIFVTLDKTENIKDFRKAVTMYESVLECHHIAGEYDYLLKVAVNNTQQLENFISDEMKQLKGVAKSNTIIVLSTIKEEI